MKIKIISTFSANGYHRYAKYFVESCKKFVDKNISIDLYVDDLDLESVENINIVKLESNVPELIKFKDRNNHRSFKKFNHDAVKFSYKVYSIIHASKQKKFDYLIWIDSDTEFYNNITEDYLLRFLPDDRFVAYLGRKAVSETGFLIFNMNHSAAVDFFQRLEWYYNTDALFDLEEWTDSYVFDVVRKEFEDSNRIKSFNISPQKIITDEHFNVIFKGYIIHYKGNDKDHRDIKLKKVLRKNT